MKKETVASLKRIDKIRRLMAKAHSRLRGMSKQQVIDEIRKTREKLWEEKLALHSR